MRVRGLAATAILVSVGFSQLTWAQAPIVAKGLTSENSQQNVDATRVSDFMGTEIVSENGDSFGVIKDMIISRSSGAIQYVIVSADNSDYRAIPWKTLALYQGQDPKDRYFILGMEKEVYHKAPVISQQEWTTFSTPGWTTYAPQVTQYYSNVRPVTPGDVRRDRRQERRGNP